MATALANLTHSRWIYRFAPMLVLLFTVSIAALHFTKSRIYNYRVAIVEGVILIVALLIYRRDLLKSIPIRNPQFLLLMALVAIYLLSASQSDFVKPGMARSFALALWIAYFWLVVYLLKSNYLRPEWLILAVSFSCFLPIARIVIDYQALQPIRYHDFVFNHLGPYSNIRHAGYHALAAYFFSLYFVLIQKQRFSVWMLLVGGTTLFVNLGFLVWTGGRQGAILAVIFTPLMVMVYFRERRLVVLLSLIVLSFLLFAGLTALGFGDSMDYLRQRLSFDRVIDIGGRMIVWTHSLDIVDGHYWLGVGPDNFSKLIRPMNDSIQPHNVFLQFLLDAGIFAMLLVILSLGLMLKSAFNVFRKTSKDSKAYCAIFVAVFFVLAYLVNSLFDGIFYHVLPIYMFSLGVALIVSELERSDGVSIQ